MNITTKDGNLYNAKIKSDPVTAIRKADEAINWVITSGGLSSYAKYLMEVAIDSGHYKGGKPKIPDIRFERGKFSGRTGMDIVEDPFGGYRARVDPVLSEMEIEDIVSLLGYNEVGHTIIEQITDIPIGFHKELGYEPIFQRLAAKTLYEIGKPRMAEKALSSPYVV